MASIYVDVDLVEFDDDELIEELESRGYAVTKTGIDGGEQMAVVNDAVWRLQRGEVEEALRIIGRSLGGDLVDLPETLRRRM